MLIYKQLLRSILTYACLIRVKFSATHIKQIQIFQNKILKVVMNTPWLGHMKHKPTQDLQITTIRDHML